MNDPQSTSAPTPDSAHADRWTVVAIAIVATVCANIIHEGVGHGGACLLTGGRPLVLSTVHFDCGGGGITVAAGGTIANLIAAVIFWYASRQVRHATRLRYFFWLSMTINLLGAGGYFLFSGIGNIGDWADVIQGQQPAWLWRVGLTVLGALSYSLFIWIALREMGPFLGRDRAASSASRPQPDTGALFCGRHSVLHCRTVQSSGNDSSGNLRGCRFLRRRLGASLDARVAAWQSNSNHRVSDASSRAQSRLDCIGCCRRVSFYFCSWAGLKVSSAMTRVSWRAVDQLNGYIKKKSLPKISV